MPLDSSKTELRRARAQAWRHGKDEYITLYMSAPVGGSFTASMYLTAEEALEIGEKLVALATAHSPRVGTAADLGYVDA